MKKVYKVKIVSTIPMKNEVELVDLDTGLPVYWKLGTALNTSMYRVGEVYYVCGAEIRKAEK